MASIAVTPPCGPTKTDKASPARRRYGGIGRGKQPTREAILCAARRRARHRAYEKYPALRPGKREVTASSATLTDSVAKQDDKAAKRNSEPKSIDSGDLSDWSPSAFDDDDFFSPGTTRWCDLPSPVGVPTHLLWYPNIHLTSYYHYNAPDYCKLG